MPMGPRGPEGRVTAPPGARLARAGGGEGPQELRSAWKGAARMGPARKGGRKSPHFSGSVGLGGYCRLGPGLRGEFRAKKSTTETISALEREPGKGRVGAVETAGGARAEPDASRFTGAERSRRQKKLSHLHPPRWNPAFFKALPGVSIVTVTTQIDDYKAA